RTRPSEGGVGGPRGQGGQLFAPKMERVAAGRTVSKHKSESGGTPAATGHATDSSANQLNTHSSTITGAGVRAPAPGPGALLPELDPAMVGGLCAREFGNMRNGNTFGGDAQYGSAGPVTLGAFEPQKGSEPRAIVSRGALGVANSASAAPYGLPKVRDPTVVTARAYCGHCRTARYRATARDGLGHPRPLRKASKWGDSLGGLREAAVGSVSLRYHVADI